MESRVKELMQQRKVSVRELGRQTGLSKSTIMKARGNIGQCSMNTLERIARALNVSIGDLFRE